MEESAAGNAPESLELAAGNAGQQHSAVGDGRLGAEARDALLGHLHAPPDSPVRPGLAGCGRIPACFQPSFRESPRNGFVSRAMGRMAREALFLLEVAPPSPPADMAERIESVENPA